MGLVNACDNLENAILTLNGTVATICIKYTDIGIGGNFCTIKPDCFNTTITCTKNGEAIEQTCRQRAGYGIPDECPADVNETNLDVTLVGPGYDYCFPCDLRDKFNPEVLAGAVNLSCKATYSNYIQDPSNNPIDLWMGAVSSNEVTMGQLKQVSVDFEPSINLGALGNTPVAILSTSDFDATKIDIKTIVITGNVSKDPSGSCVEKSSRTDLNGDGVRDIKIFVTTSCLKVTLSDTELTLTGNTTTGIHFYGTDSVNLVNQ